MQWSSVINLLHIQSASQTILSDRCLRRGRGGKKVGGKGKRAKQGWKGSAGRKAKPQKQAKDCVCSAFIFQHVRLCVCASTPAGKTFTWHADRDLSSGWVVCLTKVSEWAEKGSWWGSEDDRRWKQGGGPEGLTKLLLLSLISGRVETIKRRRQKWEGKRGYGRFFFCRRTLQAMEERGGLVYWGDEGKRVFLSDSLMNHKYPMKNGSRQPQGGLACGSASLHFFPHFHCPLCSSSASTSCLSPLLMCCSPSS